VTVRLPEVPESAGEVVDSALRSFTEAGEYRLRTLSGKRADAITRVQPHPAYTLGLRDIVGGRGLDAARQTSWRFLLEEQGNAVAAAEVAIDTRSSALSFAGINAGPQVFSTAEALGPGIEKLDTEPGDWVVRFLRIPALYLCALWLHEETANQERIYPLAPAPDYVQTGVPYSWGELSEAILPDARRRLAEENPTPGTI
jgi:hypothetical protein